jgi:hypothetical protein
MFATPIEAVFVGKLSCFTPLIDYFHTANVWDVDGMIDVMAASIADASVGALRATMSELTSPSDIACLEATMRELGVYRERLHAARRFELQ